MFFPFSPLFTFFSFQQKRCSSTAFFLKKISFFLISFNFPPFSTNFPSPFPNKKLQKSKKMEKNFVFFFRFFSEKHRFSKTQKKFLLCSMKTKKKQTFCQKEATVFFSFFRFFLSSTKYHLSPFVQNSPIKTDKTISKLP